MWPKPRAVMASRRLEDSQVLMTCARVSMCSNRIGLRQLQWNSRPRRFRSYTTWTSKWPIGTSEWMIQIRLQTWIITCLSAIVTRMTLWCTHLPVQWIIQDICETSGVCRINWTDHQIRLLCLITTYAFRVIQFFFTIKLAECWDNYVIRLKHLIYHD
jgi:hypothetical protein